MSQKKVIKIHETAYVTSIYRARYESISKDIYANLWKNEKATSWIENYANAVSHEEDFTHSLRNRFFFEKIKEANQKHGIEVLINFGSGFSMYPYLLNEDMIHIEIDKPDIIAYKKDRIENFLNDYKLPNRNVHYISTDFSTNYENELLSKIDDIKGNKTSFILLEGVLFFLSRNETTRLFNLFSKIQKKNDMIGSVSYNDTIEDTIVFQKLIQYFKQQVVLNNQFEYQTLNDSFYQNLNDYSVIDHQDYYSTKLTFAPEKELIDDMLNENLYILKNIHGTASL
jgi:O-methyltransferase involved in polyketide biosynthesis